MTTNNVSNFSITGSSNQVLVNGDTSSAHAGALTLTLPQFIGTSNAPTFQALTLSGSGSGMNLKDNTITSGTFAPINWLGLDSSSGAVFYGRIIDNIISNTAGSPQGRMVFMTQENGTLLEYMNIDGSTQSINLEKTVNISGLTASKLVATDSGKNLTSTVSGLSPGFTGLSLSGLSANGLIATDGSKNLTSSVSGLSPTLTGLNLSGLTASSLIATDSSKNLTSTTSGLVPTLSGLILSSTAHALGLNTLTTAQFTSQTPAQGAIAFTTDSETPIFFDGMQNQLVASQSWVNSNFASLSGSYANPSWITSLAASKLTGQVALANGGTAANLTASNGGICYSTSSALAILSGTATANKILYSGSSAAPSWSVPTFPVTASAASGKIIVSDGTNWIASTPTFPNASATSGKYIKSDGTNWIASTTTLPDTGTSGKILRGNGTNYVETTSTFADTYTASNLLYSNGANTVTGLATANNGVLATNGSGVPSITSTLPSAVQTNITSLGSSISTVYQNSAQPRFSARYTSTISNVTGNSVVYTIVPDTADTNVATMLNTSTGVVTIPYTGFYQFGGMVYLSNLGASNTNVVVDIVTTARTFIAWDVSAASRDSNANLACPFQVGQLFTAGDTVSITVKVDGGTQVVAVKGSSTQITYFYGYLLD